MVVSRSRAPGGDLSALTVDAVVAAALAIRSAEAFHSSG